MFRGDILPLLTYLDISYNPPPPPSPVHACGDWDGKDFDSLLNINSNFSDNFRYVVILNNVSISVPFFSIW